MIENLHMDRAEVSKERNEVMYNFRPMRRIRQQLSDAEAYPSVMCIQMANCISTVH